MVFHAPDSSTEVVTTIDVITYPRETAIMSDIHLRSAIGVGIAGTTEGIVDTSVAQVHIGVAADVTFVTATIYIFGLSQFFNISLV